MSIFKKKFKGIPVAYCLSCNLIAYYVRWCYGNGTAKYHSVACPNCHKSTPIYEKESDAKTHWSQINKKAPSDELGAKNTTNPTKEQIE